MTFAYLISNTKIKDERLGLHLKLKRFLAQSPTRGELINLSRRPITTIETSQTTHRYPVQTHQIAKDAPEYSRLIIEDDVPLRITATEPTT
jgi:hypothetical protein